MFREEGLAIGAVPHMMWAVANTRLIGALILVVIFGGLYAIITIPKESDPDVPKIAAAIAE